MSAIYDQLRDMFSAFDGCKKLRMFAAAPANLKKIAHEEWQVWQVEQGDATCLVVVQVYEGTRDFGDNGFDVFVQACGQNNTDATIEAVREICQRYHSAPVKVGR